MIEIFKSALSNPLACSVTVLLLITYSLNFFLSDCIAKVGLVAGNTLIANTYVWNVVTSCFFETHFIKLAGDIVALFFVTRELKISMLDQFGLYLIFSVLACTVGTSAYCFLRFFGTGLEEMLMEPIYGFSGVFVALLMYARRQQRGEPIHFTVPQVTYQNLPLLVVVGQMLLWVVGLRHLALDLPFTIVSLFFSWSYLRFYYRYEEGGQLGDKSDEFAFVSMFPEALHMVVVPLTTAFYNLVALVGIFPELEQVEKKLQHHLRYDDSIKSGAVPESPLLAPLRQDLVQERRRAKALKLLDAKMAELAKEPEGWDDKDVENGDTESAAPVPKSELSSLRI